MPSNLHFPTTLHQDSAALIKDYFRTIPNVDTVLVVNSCARGKAVPESDLDFAILVTPDTTPAGIKDMEHAWQIYSEKQPTLLKYRQLHQFAYLHLDIIDGNYYPTEAEMGGGIDYFEVAIGNQLCYSAPMNSPGTYFQRLKNKWLPYYNEELRLQRLQMTKDACIYDLDHIPFYISRGLYFQAFDILTRAFQKYLQVLFIANSTYPIAYNKWIKEQIVDLLNMPELYPKLPPILSVCNIEGNQVNDKAKMLLELLMDASLTGMTIQG